MKRKIALLLLSVLLVVPSLYVLKRNIKSQVHQKTKHSEAYMALQFLGSSAAFPGTDIPPDAYGKARDFFNSRYAGTGLKMQSNTSWQSIGPNNVGGRTISIALDPADTAVIWLGSASGGLWKSTTGGYGSNAWQYVPTGFPVLGVGAIAINPLNTNEMYIGTGETYDYGTSVNGLVIRTTRGSNGIGILKSTDGGLTWTHSLNWNYQQQRGVWDVIINPLNPNTLYAGTTQGIYKSLNAGASWSFILNNTMVMDLVMDPNDTTILYAGIGNLTSPVHGLYKTSNAGVNWTKLTNGLPTGTNSGRISIDVFKNNSNIVMAHFANDFASVGLYKSINKGLTWTQVSSADVASYQGWYAKCLKMKDNNSNQLFTGGVYLYESFNGGSSLVQVSNYTPGAMDTLPWPDLHDLISNPFDANKIYLLSDAGLYRSNNFGQSWKWCADGYNVSQFYHGSVAANDSNLALGGLQDRSTYRYNGSLNWVAVTGGDGTFNAIDPTDPSIMYAGLQYLNIGKSVDSGYTYTLIFTGNNPAFVAPYMLAPSNPSVIYAGDENINYSPDQGNNWSAEGPVDNNNTILSMDVSHSDENKIYFATAPTTNNPMHVFLSTDGALTYTDVSAGLPNRYPRDIAVDPLNDDIAYIVFSGFASGHIYKTVNNGGTWTNISASLPDVPFHTILVYPGNSNVVFAGSDFGIFVSTDAGSSWQAFNPGLPEAVLVFDLQYSPSNNALLAFTHGHGAYKFLLDGLGVGMHQVASPVTGFKVYPTLFDQELTIEFSANHKANGTFSLVDQNGKIIFSRLLNSAHGKNRVTVQIPAAASGIYFCRFQGEQFSLVQKTIKY